jgi:hypothetical protein
VGGSTDELESLTHEIKALDLYYNLFPWFLQC